MKRWLVCAGLLGVVAMVFLAPSSKRSDPSDIPAPTEWVQKKADHKEFRRQRQQWIEDMHAAAPGVDWRDIDARTRRQKREQRLERRAQLRESGDLQKRSGPGFYAGDNLYGEWRERGSDNQAGRIRMVDVDLSTNSLYAASDGGNLWKADLNGNGWTSLNDFAEFRDMVFFRRFANGGGHRLIVAQGWPAIVSYSDDEGQTWNTATGLTAIGGWGWFRRGVVLDDASRTIYLLGTEWDFANSDRMDTLYKSTDQGASFTQIATFPFSDGSHHDLVATRVGSTRAYFLDQDQFLEISPSDALVPVATIPVVQGFGSISSVLAAATASTSPPTFYAGFTAGSTTYFHRSLDGGATWTAAGSAPTGPFMRNSLGVGKTHAYFGGVNAFRVAHASSAWNLINEWWEYYGDIVNKLHADVPAMQSFDTGAGEITYASTDGGVFRSDDALASVTNISLQGLRISQYYSTYTHRTNPDVIYAGSQDQGFQRATSDPGGILDLVQTISGDYGHLSSANDGESIWTNYPGFAMFDPTGTASPSYTMWNFVGSNYLWLPPLTEDPNDPNSAYVGGGGSTGGSRLWHLTYAAGSISASEGSYDFGGGTGASIAAMKHSSLDSQHRYVINEDGQFYHSADGGSTWTPSPGFTGPPSHYFYGSSIVCSPTTLGRVWVAGSGYSNPAVFVSDDHGMTFAPLNTGLPNTLVYDMDVAPDGTTLYAATEVGAYAYIQDDAQWYDLGDVDGPDQLYWSVEFVPGINTARFATYGRGIWDFALLTPPTAVGDEVASLPQPLLLSNYPNPFNPMTTIRFRTPSEGRVSVEIFNLQGQRVRALLAETLPAGDHEVQWNGTNDAGREVASGIYVYRLQLGERSLTETMALVR